MKKLNLKWRITIITAIIITLISIASTFFSIVLANNTFDSIESSQVYPSDSELTNGEIEQLELERKENSKIRFIYCSILILLCTILISCILIYLIVKNTIKPIEEISNEIKKIDSNNLYIRLSEDYSKDINEITIAFNNMTRKLENSFELQKQFAANASHELKTPIGAILTNIEVHEMINNTSLDEYKSLIDLIKRNIIRTKDLIDQLLILSNNEMTNKGSKINLEKLFHDIKSEMVFLSERNNIVINVKQVQGEIIGNYELIYIAFLNLVQNAIKYNKKNGVVNISCIEDAKNYIISIEDTGIGISEDELDNIFTPFYRSDKSRSRDFGGSGLGLSIVKEIIEKHEGEIKIESKISVGTKIEVVFRQ